MRDLREQQRDYIASVRGSKMRGEMEIQLSRQSVSLYRRLSSNSAIGGGSVGRELSSAGNETFPD